MTALKVAPDKTWLLTEEHLRFAVDAMVPPRMVPLVVAADLRKGIEILERHRGWRRVETVPARQAFAGKPCCEQMRAKPGTVLTLIFRPSDFQGDTDDAHNNGTVSCGVGDNRLLDQGVIDWVAIVHFWEPAEHIDLDQVAEEMKAPMPGHVDWDSVPMDLWPVLKQRGLN